MSSRQAFVLLTLLSLQSLASSSSLGQEFLIDRSTIESWIFQSQGDAKAGRKALESQIELKVRAIEQSVTLTEEQRRQLHLAGNGDVKRFFDRVNSVFEKIESMKLDQRNFNDAYQLAVPLQTQVSSGLFGKESLLDKVSRGILTDEQRDAWEHAERERNRRSQEAIAKSSIATIGLTIPLTAKQRDELLRRVIDKLNEPRWQGRPLQGPFASMLVSYHLAKIPVEDLESFLDAEQIKAFQLVKKQVGPIEQYLMAQGVLDKEADE